MSSRRGTGSGEKRAELRRSYLALLVELVGLYEERGEYGPAFKALQKMVGEEPAHEEAHADLMRHYATSGRRHEALLQYERLQEALSRELASEPGAASRQLHEEITPASRGTPSTSDRRSLPKPTARCEDFSIILPRIRKIHLFIYTLDPSS